MPTPSLLLTAAAIVAGVPGWTGGGDVRGAGAVAVFDGPRSALLTLAQPRPGDRFGAAVARGDFDGDGRSDLAIGAPGATGDAPEGDASGQPSGLRGEVIVRYATGTEARIPGPYVPGELTSARFGEALAAGDFDGDGRSDLAVGAPGDDPADREVEDEGTGAVHLLFGSPAGLSGERARVLARPRRDDVFFGSVLAVGDVDGDRRPDLVEGERGDQDASDGDERPGHLSYCPGAAGGPVSCRAVGGRTGPGPASLAVGDVVGGRGAEVIAGLPYERYDYEDRRAPSGAVRIHLATVSGPSARPRLTITQRTRGVPGRAEEFDRFGAAVAFSPGRTIAVGAPGEDRGRGAVTVLRLRRSGRVDSARRLDEATRGVPGRPRAGDQLGQALAFAGRALVAGAPGERGGIGLVLRFPGARAAGARALGLTDLGVRASAPAEAYDGPRLGSALAP